LGAFLAGRRTGHDGSFRQQAGDGLSRFVERPPWPIDDQVAERAFGEALADLRDAGVDGTAWLPGATTFDLEIAA
jgi:hypothetical protein